jgi:phosphoglycerol geranylgeranyltransferase
MIGKVEKYYREKIETQGAMLFSLIDPDKTYLEAAAKQAKESYEGGADVILVGGSIGAQGSLLDETVKQIKEATPLPVVLFPGNISGLSGNADAVYFMHMLNSRDVYWMSTALIQSAPVVMRMGIEAIPTTYLVVEPGRAVGWIGNANVVPRDRGDLAAACALAAKYSGSHVLVMDCGSGAPEHAPLPMISAVRKATGNDVLFFLGGGVKTPEQAFDVVKAGTHGVQIGGAFEEGLIKDKAKKMSAMIRKAGKERV